MPTERKDENGSRRWSKSFGPYRARARVFEAANGVLYSEIGGERRSLRHRNKKAAEAWAKKKVGELLTGTTGSMDPMPTVKRVFAAYVQFRTPRKGLGRQKHDHRCSKMWTRVLGANKDFRLLSLREWERAMDNRMSGAIDALGFPVNMKKRKPVRARTVEVDAHWLKAVLNWAVRWMDDRGRYLLQTNPARGFEAPHEKNPVQPLATQDRFEAVRAVTDQVLMRVTWSGKRKAVRSYLSELLDLVDATGRRIGAVVQLRYQDLSLDVGPHGSICWPSDTDKMGRAWSAPLSKQGRAAVDRVMTDRARVGLVTEHLFPSPRNPSKPVSKDLASGWLKKAEALAGVPKQKGGLWHPYRRKWATERKHMPDVDVARAGGWSDLQSLKTAYQQADDATLLEVVTQPRLLREGKR